MGRRGISGDGLMGGVAGRQQAAGWEASGGLEVLSAVSPVEWAVRSERYGRYRYGRSGGQSGSFEVQVKYRFELVTRSCCAVPVGRDRCADSTVRDGVSTRPWIVDDDLWALIEPLLPPWPERSPGPRPVLDRSLPPGHPVRPLQRHSLATPALGAGVRLRTDLLAASGPVAEGRRLRPAPPGPAREAERGR